MTMTDETTPPTAALAPTAPSPEPAAPDEPDPTADLHLTPRETGAWELATGITLEQMPQSYLGALAAWKRAKDSGAPITIDQALDTDWNVIGAAMGVQPVDPTGSAGTPTPPTSNATGTNASS